MGYTLGMNSKKASRALTAFATKYNIREALAQRGKAQIKVCLTIQTQALFTN